MTGQLGTAQSYLGNIVLGTVGSGGSGPYIGMADSFVFLDTLTSNQIGDKNYGDNLLLVDNFTLNKVKLLGWSDTITFTDSSTGVLVYPFSDSLSLSDSLTYYVAYTLTPDILDIGDFFTLNQSTRWSTADQLVLYDSLALEMYYRINFGSTLTLTDTFVGNAVNPISDNLNFTENWVGVESSALIDSLSVLDTLKYNRNFSVKLSPDIMTFVDTTTKTLANSVSMNDTIFFSENPHIAYVWTTSFSSTLSFSEVLVREIFEKPLTDTLSLSDSFTDHHISYDQIADELVFSDTMSMQHATKNAMADNLVFNDGFVVKEKGTLNSGTGIFPSPPLTGVAYQPPSIPVGVININQMTVIQGLGNTIVLPSPEFNDYNANQSKTVVQRSMTGVFRSYIKRTTRQKLNWKFIIPKYKADELRAFILAEINNQLTVIDWQGNIWHLHLLSDTIEFAETGRWGGPILGGDKNEVTLEFTGTQYA